jgi:Domain of unknown function (DUF4390)
MNRVDTTAFSTHALTRCCPEPAAPGPVGRAWVRWWMGLAIVLLSVLLAGPAWAREPEVRQHEVRRLADGAQLSVRLALEPSPAVEDALLKGVPMYFAWQADIVRERWYWTDKRISTATRTLRLAYQPLTRRWRLSLSTDVGASASGMQYALHQNFDSLNEALAGISRVATWQIAEPGRLEEGVKYLAQWRFRLDLSLLPRPFQIGVANQPGWLVEVERTLEVPARNEADGAPAAAEVR